MSVTQEPVPPDEDRDAPSIDSAERAAVLSAVEAFVDAAVEVFVLGAEMGSSKSERCQHPLVTDF